MNQKQLREISCEYDSYQGTAHNSINKTGVAVENFESVLNTAISLAQENEDLRREINSKPAAVAHHKDTPEDIFLYAKSEDELTEAEWVRANT